MYQYINIEGNSLTEAQAKLADTTAKQREEALELYLKIIPIMKQYNIDRGQIVNKGKYNA